MCLHSLVRQDQVKYSVATDPHSTRQWHRGPCWVELALILVRPLFIPQSAQWIDQSQLIASSLPEP